MAKITADEGGKAIESAKKQTPDVILRDILLPGMTGPDDLKRLKKDPTTAQSPRSHLWGVLLKMKDDSGTMVPVPTWKNRPSDWTKAAIRYGMGGCHSARAGPGSSDSPTAPMELRALWVPSRFLTI